MQRAHWTIGELGLPHQHFDAGGSFGGLDTERPAYREPVMIPLDELCGPLEF